LRAHGVTARADAYCTSPDAVAQVSNLSAGVRRRQGDVLCLVDAEAGPRTLQRQNFGKHGPLLVLLNIRCNVYPSGQAARRQVRRVVAALEQLRRRYG
jgi:hypothetical protein